MFSISENCKEVMISYKTDTGLKRKENEDSFCVIDNRDDRYDTRSLGMLFAVADGMSGYKGGASSSHLACEGLLDYYAETSNIIDMNNVVKLRINILKDLFHRVHLKIYNHSLKYKEYEGMGTTLSALIYVDDMALIAHVGDSRIYRLRDTHLEKMTQDETMAQLSVEIGYISQKDAENHPQRHVLTNAVGQSLENECSDQNGKSC